MTARTRTDYGSMSDAALARCIAARDRAAVRLVTQRNNQRLFRVAWSILKSRAEAEDCVQSAYLSAFSAIGRFEGRSSLSTWLTRITINEALQRARTLERRRRQLEENEVALLDDYREKMMRGSQNGTPEADYARGQLRGIIEQAIAGLPDEFRLVFILREVEGLSIEETAETLSIVPGTVKTRHLRARRRLQEALAPEIEATLAGVFPFAGADCEAMTQRVLEGF